MKNSVIVLILIQLFLYSCSSDNGVDGGKVKSIKLDTSELTLKIGDTHQFVVSCYPENIKSVNYNWEIEDSHYSVRVVEIDQNGKLKALAVGEVYVIVSVASGENKEISYKCKVTVQPVSAENIKLNKNQLSLKVGESETLTYSIHPENTTYKEIVWESGNKDIVTLADGKVTALKPGETKITATIKDTQIKDVCTVIVETIEIEEIKLEITTLELEVGEKYQLPFNLLPENTTDKRVSWASSNDNVSVDQEGLITALKVGQSEVIINSLSNEAIQARCVVDVKPKEGKVAFENIDVDIINNSNGYNTPLLFDTNIEMIEWESSNPSVVEVNKKGVLKAKSLGTSTIKAKVKGAANFAEFTVNSRSLSEVVSITAIGKNLVSNSVRSEIIFHSIIRNSSISEIKINGVIMTDESGNVRQLKNSDSGYIVFDPIIINGSVGQSELNYFSSWKVIYQINVGGVDYDLVKDISSNVFASLY